MINSAQTLPPGTHVPGSISAAETIPPGGGTAKDSVYLTTGESIAGSYVIHTALDDQGKQSTVYLAKKWGKPYVVKVYHSGWQPSEQMLQFLCNVHHPNIANLVESGTYAGQHYEIYDYYPEGTLERAGAVPVSSLQSVVIPSINEGLHVLHTNGIVHCDIKPSNLFYADNGSRVLIGDCGISGYTNADGKLIDTIRGTPEYAPRVKSLMWSAALSPAYDYGSFGLVLCRLVLGRSLFGGMSLEEIARTWENGLELPSQITGRIAVLIRGLLTEDEHERWDYNRVKRWCEGEYMRPTNRSIYARMKKAPTRKALIFGRFDNEVLTVSTLHQLAVAIRAHWDQATRVIRRQELIDFVRQFDTSLPDKVRTWLLHPDIDAAVFKLLTAIDEEASGIFYRGKAYPTIPDFVDALASGRDETARQFLFSGLFVYYLREKGCSKPQVDQLEQMIRRGENMASITTICFLLQDRQSIRAFGQTVSTLDELAGALAGKRASELAELLETDAFQAWFYRLGYENELEKMQEIKEHRP